MKNIEKITKTIKSYFIHLYLEIIIIFHKLKYHYIFNFLGLMNLYTLKYLIISLKFIY